MKFLGISLPLLIFSLFRSLFPSSSPIETGRELIAKKDSQANTISVYVQGENQPRVVQNAAPDFRPFIHPLISPDLKSTFTEFSPSHHKHQTGIYWGITRINQRDFFHNPQGDYWRRVSFDIVQEKGSRVSWQTVYELLDAKGATLMTETQTWTFHVKDQEYFMDLEWEGKAEQDLTFNQYDYGGLFVRMPWKQGMTGQVTNAARQTNLKADAQPSTWINVGLQLEGRDDLAHIALFDHPQNRNFPHKWRVDGQMGIGTAKAREGDWQLKKGEIEISKHQIVAYTGTLNDVVLNQHWTAFSGRQGLYSSIDLWRIAQEEGKKAKFLTPDEAVTSMTLKKGFAANVWSAEPMVTQPMAFCWDDRGRLWVAENRDYESRGSGFSNSGDSRIVILEDTDNDGKADKRTVFMEGIAFPAALAVGFDGVYVGAPPNLLFVPDRNKDDKADLNDIQILLTGWGIRDRHETLNSLHWGPDGWLYGLQGFATPSIVGKPLGKGKIYKGNDPYPTEIPLQDSTHINGGVWRYHPTKAKFEVVAHGFSNPWGIDYDAHGELFMTACVIPHLWHVIPGGIYHRQGGQHFNRFHYSDIRTIADHSHRSAHGGARVYQSDAFPKEETGKIFMANIHEHAVLSDILQPKGSGFVGIHGDEFLEANNAQWVGFSMEIGPDGALYVLDWHDADICGSEVMNKETGRIFRIQSTTTSPTPFKNRYSDLAQWTDLQLAEIQTSASDWHTRRARLILQQRAVKGKINKKAISHLKQLAAKEQTSNRLKAIWALYQINALSTSELIQFTTDSEAYVRAWAIRLLCEEQGDNPTVIAQLKKVLTSEQSPIVRKYAAAALQRITVNNRWEIAEVLLQYKEDAEDHNIPKMLWYAIEPLIDADPSKALALVTKSKIPLVTNYTGRKLADIQKMALVLDKVTSASDNFTHLLQGIQDALDASPDLQVPANWRQHEMRIGQLSPSFKKIVNTIGQKLDDNEATQQLLTTLLNTSKPITERQNALTTLAVRSKAELVAHLPNLLKEAALRKFAIRALSSYDRPTIAQIILNDYKTYNASEKSEAILTLSSRSSYGNLLTKALASGQVAKKDIPPYVARQLIRVVGSGFVEVYGPIELQSNSTLNEMQRYKQLLGNTTLKANLQNGKILYQNTCAPCHKLHGTGGEIGPDITGANRGNLDYLLSNIIDPSSDIQDDYKMVVITMRDGRLYTGNIAAETENQVTLKIVGQDPVRLPKSQIQSREVTPVSLMPPGLLSNLAEQEVVDLVRYLQQLKAD